MRSISQELRDIMARKKTNLCLSADVTTMQELVQLIHATGPYICILKTHCDILTDFDYNVSKDVLRDLSDHYDFLIFEDRKFCDIGNTVKMQLCQGLYRIQNWCDLVNCHTVAGPGTLQALFKCSQESGFMKCRGCLVICQMSSKGNLCCGKDYFDNTMEMVKNVWDTEIPDNNEESDVQGQGLIDMKKYFFGFIGQNREPIRSALGRDDFILMSPGVALDSSTDSMGQQYRSPEKAILEDGVDVIIVGRAIYGEGSDRAGIKAEAFRTRSWKALSMKATK